MSAQRWEGRGSGTQLPHASARKRDSLNLQCCCYQAALSTGACKLSLK